MAYFVFMIDLEDSRKMSEEARRESQARLKDAKNAVNDFLADTDTRVAFSSGDSLQGFTKDPARALRICLLLVCLMYPIRLHCGIGAGEIYVIDKEEGTNASDGPAYHDALAALERSKREGREVAAHFGTDADGLIDSLLESARLLRDANTQRQSLFVAIACLSTLSGADGTILEKGIANAFLAFKAFPEAGARLDERRGLAQFISASTDTSIQNAYDIIRKSNALIIAQSYRSCLDYLAT